MTMQPTTKRSDALERALNLLKLRRDDPAEIALAIANITAVHLLVQGAPSKLGASCLYRANLVDSGKVLACAAGFWMPDSEYDSDFETIKITDIESAHFVPEFITEIASRETMLTTLLSMQRFHDGLPDMAWDAKVLPIGCAAQVNQFDGSGSVSITSRLTAFSRVLVDVFQTEAVDLFNPDFTEVFGMGYIAE